MTEEQKKILKALAKVGGHYILSFQHGKAVAKCRSKGDKITYHWNPMVSLEDSVSLALSLRFTIDSRKWDNDGSIRVTRNDGLSITVHSKGESIETTTMKAICMAAYSLVKEGEC